MNCYWKMWKNEKNNGNSALHYCVMFCCLSNKPIVAMWSCLPRNKVINLGLTLPKTWIFSFVICISELIFFCWRGFHFCKKSLVDINKSKTITNYAFNSFWVNKGAWIGYSIFPLSFFAFRLFCWVIEEFEGILVP
jgi:hypothetical protein